MLFVRLEQHEKLQEVKLWKMYVVNLWKNPSEFSLYMFLWLEKSDSQQKTEVTPEDSDLDRKRRETEALLQSIGISPEPPLGTSYSVLQTKHL